MLSAVNSWMGDRLAMPGFTHACFDLSHESSEFYTELVSVNPPQKRPRAAINSNLHYDRMWLAQLDYPESGMGNSATINKTQSRHMHQPPLLETVGYIHTRRHITNAITCGT